MSIFKAHIRLIPEDIKCNDIMSFNVPLILIKAPLNFIYLNLNGINNINKNNIFFTFLDFDAY
jgi:hypothetical protein